MDKKTVYEITNKEFELLTRIIESEYQDIGDDLTNAIDHQIWLDYVVKSKADGGVLTSLQSKQFVTVKIVSPKDSAMYRDQGITDSTVALTETGVRAYQRGRMEADSIHRPGTK